MTPKNRSFSPSADWRPEEIAQVLKTAEILQQKGSVLKINVSSFCAEIGLSRKNAYKHKRHFEENQSAMAAQWAGLSEQHQQDLEKIRLLEARLAEAEIHQHLRGVLRELVIDYQKKEPGQTPKRQRLLEKYNRISASLGVEPLTLWE